MAGCASGAPAADRLDISGDIAVHDPAIWVGEEDEPWYVFSTGDVRIGLGSPVTSLNTVTKVPCDHAGILTSISIGAPSPQTRLRHHLLGNLRRL